MVRFNKTDFKKSIEDVKAGRAGGNLDVKPGVYIVTLERATFKKCESGAEQVSFGMQIAEDSEVCPNLYLWWNQTVTNKDGKANYIGYDQLNSWLHKLSAGQFNVDAFLQNPDSELEKFIGSVFKVKCNPKLETSGFKSDNVKFMSLIESVYKGVELDNSDSSGVVPEIPESPVTPTAPDPDPADLDGDVDIQVGDLVVYTDPQTGKRLTGTIATFLEGANKVLIQPNNKALQPVGLDSEHVLLHPDFEEHRKKLAEEAKASEEEEEEEEAILQVGSTVNYQFNGQDCTGTVKEVNEQEGWVKIPITKNGKKFVRKVPIIKLKLVAPF